MYLLPAAHQQRHEKKETKRENTGERDHVGADELPQPALLGFDFPDRVQSVLQLNHDTDRGKHQCTHAEQCGKNAACWLARARQHQLDRCRARVAKQSSDLPINFAPNRILTENQPSHGNRDDDQGSNRENGIIGQCRAEAGILMRDPVAPCLLDDLPQDTLQRPVPYFTLAGIFATDINGCASRGGRPGWRKVKS